MTAYRLTPQVLRAPLDHGELVLNVETGMYHLINETGHALLSALEDGLSLPDAAGKLAESSGQPPDRTLADAARFVRDLAERGLLNEVAP
jgi:hypothetical protein